MLSATDIVLVIVFWLIAWRLWYRQRATHLPQVPEVRSWKQEQAPLVSMIVPARNEAHQIEACVQSLLAQTYPRFEVIVVNDRSEDETGAILARLAASDHRLTVVEGKPLPEDWMGKTHAIYQGYQRAQGDWLFFVDADTVHAPGLLSGVVALLLKQSASCATVVGRQKAPGWGAYLVNLGVFTGIFMLTDTRKYQDPKCPESTLNGQYIIFSRQAYEAIGTHAAIKHFPSDDAALGYLAKLHGYIPLLIKGDDQLETTMYRTLREAWRGWSRSMVNNIWTVLGPGRGSVVLSLLPIVMGFFWVLPWVIGIYGVVEGDSSSVAVGLLLVIAGLIVLRLVKKSWLVAVRDVMAMPLSVLLLTIMIWGAIIQAWRRGGMVWKGRVMHSSHYLPPWNPPEVPVEQPHA